MTDWRTQAIALSDDALLNEILSTHDLALDIINGHVQDSVWNGYGGSLCVRGMVYAEEAVKRWPNGTIVDVLHSLVRMQFLMTSLGERIIKPDPSAETGKERVKVNIAVTSVHPLCCNGCGGRRGFTNLAIPPKEWWVCGKCFKPTEPWFRGQGDDVLNKFSGGPLDGMVYTSSSVLDDARLCNLILGYQFTPEIIRSESTGATARVWSHSPTQPGSVSPSSTADIHSSSKGNNMSVPETQESQTEPNAVPAPPAEPVQTADLEVTRKRLGLSRTPVSAEAGVTVAQLARIEKGGSRTTAAEAKQVRDALARLEASAQAAAAAAPAPATEGDPAASDPA